MTTIIKIKDFHELVDFISSIDTDKYFFRGENKVYPSIVSSAFRPITEIDGLPKYYNVDNLISEYYKEVGYRLSDVERDNFIFFCQHHGIPTNLIDISSNILTGLFFSCVNTEKSIHTDEGRLFLFDRTKTFNFNPNKLKYSSLLHGFSDLDEYSLEIFINSMQSILMKNETFFCECIIDFFKKYIYFIDNFHCAVTNPKSKKYLIELFKNNDLFNSSATDLLKYCIELHSIEFCKPENSKFKKKINEMRENKKINKTHDYIFGLIEYLHLLHFMIEDYSSGFDTKELVIPTLPYFVVGSTVYFDRMKTQSGSFFYQNYLGFSDEEFFSLNSLNAYNDDDDEIIEPDNTRIFQNYVPDITLEISDRSSILNLLNKMGVTTSSLFNDVDTIALQLVKKQI